MLPVEPFLEAVGRRLAEQVEAFDPDIIRYADYALNGQGKHLRAALVALTANALGELNDSHASRCRTTSPDTIPVTRSEFQ